MCWATTATVTRSPAMPSSRGKRSRSSALRRSSIRSPASRPALYRPPWLCHWPWVMSTLRQHGLQVVSGTFAHPLEIFQPAATKLTDSAVRLTRPGTILIFHDGREARGGPRDQSVAAIGPLIERLADRGYRFTTVDQLLGISAVRLSLDRLV